MAILTILILPIHEHGIFLHLFGTWDFNLMNFVGFYLAYLIEHNHYTGSGGDMLEISAFVTNLLNKNIINLFRIVLIHLGNKN